MVDGASTIEDIVDIAAKLAKQLVQFYGCKRNYYKRQA